MKRKEKILDVLTFCLLVVGCIGLIVTILLIKKICEDGKVLMEQSALPVSGNVLLIPPPEITIEVYPTVSLNSVAEVPKFTVEDFETEIEDAYVEMILEITELYNISPSLVISVIESESHGHANSTSGGGAQGLMQIIPAWQQERMKRLGVTSLYDPYGNILVGTDILSELLKKYDIPTALMCYNEGQYGGAVERAAAGNYSHYALKIINRMNELDSNLNE